MVVLVALVVVTVIVTVVVVVVAVVEVHVELGDTSCWFGWSCVGCVGCVGDGCHSSVRCVENESKACLGASGSHWVVSSCSICVLGMVFLVFLWGTKSDCAQIIHNRSEFIVREEAKNSSFLQR